jgi:hypothetical protein
MRVARLIARRQRDTADFERREPYPQKVEKAPSRNGSGHLKVG